MAYRLSLIRWSRVRALPSQHHSNRKAMKLTDFSNFLFSGWVAELHEAFNTKIEFDWQKYGDTFMAAFELNDTRYVVQLHPPIVPPVQGRKIAEVSFFLYDESDERKSFSTSKKLTTTPTAVYGVVLNAALEKANDFDGFYFTAEARHSSNDELEKKFKIYLALAQRACRNLGGTVYMRDGESGIAVLWVKQPLLNPGKWIRPVEKLTISTK